MAVENPFCGRNAFLRIFAIILSLDEIRKQYDLNPTGQRTRLTPSWAF